MTRLAAGFVAGVLYVLAVLAQNLGVIDDEAQKARIAELATEQDRVSPHWRPKLVWTFHSLSAPAPPAVRAMRPDLWAPR